jgi:hypothetical protein
MPSQEYLPFSREWQTVFWLNCISVTHLRGSTRWEAGEVDRLAHAGSISRRTRMLAKNFQTCPNIISIVCRLRVCMNAPFVTDLYRE